MGASRGLRERSRGQLCRMAHMCSSLATPPVQRLVLLVLANLRGSEWRGACEAERGPWGWAAAGYQRRDCAIAPWRDSRAAKGQLGGLRQVSEGEPRRGRRAQLR